MKKLLLAGVVLTGFIAAPAIAADIAVQKPVYKAPPPVAAPVRWTGCYIGGHVGGLWAHKDWTDRTSSVYSLGNNDFSGWVAGGQGGCDYQFAGSFVLGIRGDGSWTDTDGSHRNPAGLGPNTNHSRIKSLTSVTGRVGYAWDRLLGYVKGGAAWERDDHSRSDASGAFFSWASETRSGWTVGVGGEYAFTNYVSAFAEYNYYDFGNRTVTFTGASGAVVDYIDIKQHTSVVRVGFNVRWGWDTAGMR